MSMYLLALFAMLSPAQLSVCEIVETKKYVGKKVTVKAILAADRHYTAIRDETCGRAMVLRVHPKHHPNLSNAVGSVSYKADQSVEVTVTGVVERFCAHLGCGYRLRVTKDIAK